MFKNVVLIHLSKLTHKSQVLMWFIKEDFCVFKKVLTYFFLIIEKEGYRGIIFLRSVYEGQNKTKWSTLLLLYFILISQWGLQHGAKMFETASSISTGYHPQILKGFVLVRSQFFIFCFVYFLLSVCLFRLKPWKLSKETLRWLFTFFNGSN